MRQTTINCQYHVCTKARKTVSPSTGVDTRERARCLNGGWLRAILTGDICLLSVCRPLVSSWRMTPIIVLQEPAISRDFLLLWVCAYVCLYMGWGGGSIYIHCKSYSNFWFHSFTKSMIKLTIFVNSLKKKFEQAVFLLFRSGSWSSKLYFLWSIKK